MFEVQTRRDGEDWSLGNLGIENIELKSFNHEDKALIEKVVAQVSEEPGYLR